MTRIAPLLLASALAATACGDDAGPRSAVEPPRACTQIGCRSAVVVQLDGLPPEARRARVCAAGLCRTVSRPGGRRVTVASERFDAARPVLVRVELLGVGERTLRRHRTLSTLDAVRPNGPLCPPPCFRASLRFDARTATFERL